MMWLLLQMHIRLWPASFAVLCRIYPCNSHACTWPGASPSKCSRVPRLELKWILQGMDACPRMDACPPWMPVRANGRPTAWERGWTRIWNTTAWTSFALAFLERNALPALSPICTDPDIACCRKGRTWRAPLLQRRSLASGDQIPLLSWYGISGSHPEAPVRQ